MAQEAQPYLLTSAATEIEASLIVQVLDGAGISAWVTGAYTSAFRAEAPGSVKIFVRERDAARATEIVREYRRQSHAEE